MDEQSVEFIEWLNRWVAHLPTLPTSSIISQPNATAIFSVDLINGFCSEGPLSSPRVARIVEPTTRLMREAWALGLRNIILFQDHHEPDAVEFGQWPPHCVKGTSEALTVPQITELPFFKQIYTINKNSIHSGLNNSLDQWLKDHPEIQTFVVVGDCTDLCTYQLAMHLRLQANERQLSRKVILPIECVDTYDMPVIEATRLGIFPHPGDLIHKIFLYHMALNGIELAHLQSD